MTLVLVESLPDPASVGIAGALRARPAWTEAAAFQGRPAWRWSARPKVRLVTIEAAHIHAEGLDDTMRREGIEPTAIVFLSKHRSESGRPTLTAHPLGNFADAALGGKPRRLTPSPGPLLTEALRCLQRAQARDNFPAEISFEATHHGPLLSTPAIFVELGSSDAQWADPLGHRVVADAVEELLGKPLPAYPVMVGLGGGHYAPRFTEAALTKRVHFSHLIPTHHAKVVPDPAGLVEELLRASPGLSGYYYHDGTLPQESRQRWFQAFADAGVGAHQSREWPPHTVAA